MRTWEWIRWMMVLAVMLMMSACGGGSEAGSDLAFVSNDRISVEECQAEGMVLETSGSSGTVLYSLSGEDAGAFAVNASTGVVRFRERALPDYETKDQYRFVAKATDGSGTSIEQNIIMTITQWQIDKTSAGGTVTKPYGCVPSPFTGKIWLDRNLGADRICTAHDDAECYGFYYQWGRGADGHEISADTIGSTDVKADDIDAVGHSDFITNTTELAGDWASVDEEGNERSAHWRQTDGSSVCPEGFRVPTIEELQAELFDEGSAQIDLDSAQKEGNTDDMRLNAYNSFLKIPSAGSRGDDAGLDGHGDVGRIWSSSVGLPPHDVGYSYVVYFSGSDAGAEAGGGIGRRVYGRSVRCIRE